MLLFLFFLTSIVFIILKGKDAAGVKPLVYPVTVVSKVTYTRTHTFAGICTYVHTYTELYKSLTNT